MARAGHVKARGELTAAQLRVLVVLIVVVAIVLLTFALYGLCGWLTINGHDVPTWLSLAAGNASGALFTLLLNSKGGAEGGGAPGAGDPTTVTAPADATVKVTPAPDPTGGDPADTGAPPAAVDDGPTADGGDDPPAVLALAGVDGIAVKVPPKKSAPRRR